MSCWDTTACLKTLCTAYNDYQKSNTDEAIKDLQRQIDVIVGVTSHGASLQDLSPKQLLYAEALSVLVSLINEPNMKNQMYLKAITALLQLSNDYETKEALQYTFNLMTSLINFVLRLPTNTTKQLISQALNLLAKLTYKNRNLNLNSTQMFDFLKFVIKKVQTATPDQCLPSLAILANLCHKNIEVQAHIKSLSDIKLLYKTLFKYLSNSSNKAYSVTSLSILSSLAMEEESGEKIFSGNNLINIIHLVFQAVVTTDNLTILQYSVDLIIDLLNQNKTFKIIAESNQLYETYVIRILNQLHSTDAHIVIKILELLNAFCGKSLTRRKLVTLLLKQIVDNDEETQMQDDHISLSPMQATVHWISKIQTLSTSVSHANILAMNFAREIVNESIEAKGTGALFAYFMELIPICLKNLFVDMKTDEEKVLKQISQRVSTSAELLISLSRDANARQAILEKFNIDHLMQLLNNIFVHYTDDLKAERSPVHQCSDAVVHVVFRSLELMVALKSFVPSGNEKYGALLQDVRLLPFLSRGFISSSKYLVHASLHIFTEALKYKEFQVKGLGESITLLNQSRQIELKNLRIGRPPTDKHQIQPVMSVAAPPLQDITNMKDSMGNITALTEKLRKGLDIKDSKVSDIMDYYEHKLAALTGRERHLEDLMEAKTKALSQSDRLLSQFRCRQAQSDAECLKLRTLLKTSEKKCETDSVRMDQFLKTKNTLESQISRLNEQMEILQQDSEKLKKLQYQYQEQTTTLEAVQKRLVASEEENASLAAMNDCLHKNSEKLKSKLEVSNEHIKMTEGEVKKLNQIINKNEETIKERDNMIKKAESMYQTKLNDIDKLSKERKETEKVLKKTEKSLHDTMIKVSSLESTIIDHESSLKDKEDQISQLQEEVDKQSQITAMINNLTSGRMNVNK